MITYGNEMCTGYIPQYEGDNSNCWTTWGSQSWGTGYEQVQYDCGSWEYQQQPGWEAPAPKVGAELLTELRLAELKRLIDRDARALRKQQEDGADRWDYPEEQQKEAQDCDGEARMEGAHLSTAMASGDLQQALAHGADAAAGGAAPQAARAAATSSGCATMEEEDGKSAAIAKAPVAATACIEDDLDDGSDEPEPPTSEEQEVVIAARRAASPPGLEAPIEQRFTVVADCLPESRNYGEMPVHAGEDVFISEDPIDGWIYAIKRAPKPDEGWIPAAAIDLFGEDDESLAEAAVAETEVQRWATQQQQQPQQQKKRGRGRGNHAGNEGSASMGDSSKRSGGGQQQQQLEQQQQQRKQQLHQSQPKNKSGRAEPQPTTGVQEESWHQHGTWWSRQRHLRPEKENSGRQRKAATTRRGGGGGAGGTSRGAVPAVSDDDIPDVKPQACGGRPAWGPPRGGPERRERKPRERAALTSLLDRLDKPLVLDPKPAVGR